MKRFVGLLLIGICMFSLMACGSSNKANDGDNEGGKTSTEVDDNKVLNVKGKTFVGVDIQEKDFAHYKSHIEMLKCYTIAFKDDGTVVFDQPKTAAGDDVLDEWTKCYGTYSQDSDKVIVIIEKIVDEFGESDADSFTLVINILNNQLILESTTVTVTGDGSNVSDYTPTVIHIIFEEKK